MDELITYVLYDIGNDTIRDKIADICKDYGLERTQFSAFRGPLTRNKREELFLQLQDVLGDQAGKILVQPVCEKDVRAALQVEHDAPESLPSAPDAAGERPEAV